jgi:hypothetical protein
MTTFINILPITAGISVGGVVGIILGIIGVLLLLIVGLIFPGSKKEIDFFTNQKYAHRGLHDAEKAENSMSAFKAAVDHGFGIELDIRLSKDGQLVVFHDDTLDRVCGRPGRVRDFTAEELATFKLSGTEDGIPTFAEVLALVDGQVPLLVEIKEDPNDSAVSAAAIDQLGSYKGLFMVESFNPFTVARVFETSHIVIFKLSIESDNFDFKFSSCVMLFTEVEISFKLCISPFKSSAKSFALTAPIIGANCFDIFEIASAV